MAESLKWGIIATGSIAHAFARGLAHSKRSELLAVASRAKASAGKFAEEFGVERAYGSYEELLADGDVEAVYIATPHPMHTEWAIKAAEAGKHILCEKPLAINSAEAMAIVEAAERNDVFLMEAFMYRCHPQTARLVELLREGVIGEVRLIRAAFGFDVGGNYEGRLLANEYGGGGILDVGCYATSFARLVAGVASGGEVAEPIEVKAVGHKGKTGVDEWTAAVLRFEGDIVAEVATGVRANMENVARIFGSEGSILLENPWIPAREGGAVTIKVKRYDGKGPGDVVVETDEWLYGLEADVVAENIERRQAAFPAATLSDTLGNIRVLDRWRGEVGVVYDREKPCGMAATVAGRALARREDAAMKYGELAGVDKKVSRLFMGVDNQPDIAYATVMFDDWFERGGTAFDTAYVYGGGKSERLLGQWVKSRGVREEVVILDKGAHTPNCFPDALTREFDESLDRLGMDYVDVYLMHRDNPDVPVGEFVDVLNEHKRAGRMRCFGASNWCMERIEEANRYAAAKGLEGMSAVSNNFSLARMVEAPWEGCLSASDAGFKSWLEKTQTPLIAWSSQARGFFTGRASRDDLCDEELVRCWYAEDNFRRLERARELAEKKGVLPINIALAYVLCQAFPTFAIIGPRRPRETRTSMPGLYVELTAEELKWLNLED